MISKEQVQHIAKLARLGLSKAELEKFQKELSSILDYVEKLKEVDISNVKSGARLIPNATIEKGMRKDKVQEQDIETVKRLIKSAPETKQGHIKVKTVF